LIKLIEIELDLIATFLVTFQLSSETKHKAQALKNAKDAWNTGFHFLEKLSPPLVKRFEPILQQRREQLERSTDTLQACCAASGRAEAEMRPFVRSTAHGKF
jgi:hypothetical protein